MTPDPDNMIQQFKVPPRLKFHRWLMAKTQWPIWVKLTILYVTGFPLCEITPEGHSLRLKIDGQDVYAVYRWDNQHVYNPNDH